MTEEEKVWRDRFAAAAMQALLTAQWYEDIADLTAFAYKVADSMLKARKS
jgi:hypothetical protein